MRNGGKFRLLVWVWLLTAEIVLAQLPSGIPTGPTQSDTTKRGVRRSSSGSALLDDSTRRVYGPKTTLWTSEQKIFNNQGSYVPLDTSVFNYHQWTYLQRLHNGYQDLGNVGTALNPIFPMPADGIGVSSGFTSYRAYYDDQEPVYYNTKSPFTRIRIIWGGQGRSMTHVEFSRNINPRWNFGFDYRPILVEKQLQGAGRGDRQVISHYYDFYSRYQSKNDRYSILFSFRRIRHRVNENGGVDLNADATEEDFYDPNARIKLTTISTEELRNGFHIFQTYQLAKPMQVYWTLDLGRSINVFNNPDKSTLSFFDTLVDSAAVENSFRFATAQSEAGIKGSAGFLFYNVYYKFRRYVVENSSWDSTALTALPFSRSGIEHYLGGRLRLQLDSTRFLQAEGEYLLDGNYRLQGKLTAPWFEVSALSQLAKPAFMPQAYRGTHDYWANGLDNVFTNQLGGEVRLRRKQFLLAPGARYQIITNHIFFKFNDSGVQKVLPVQATGNQQLLQYYVRMNLPLVKNLFLRPMVTYSNVIQSDQDALQIPELFVNTQLAFENYLFKKAIQVQLGAEFHWRSSYFAYGYDPAIQSYYWQNQVQSESFPFVDFFFNGRFQGGRFFVRYNNLMQNFLGRGYQPTPGYPAQRPVIDFGFDLILFD